MSHADSMSQYNQSESSIFENKESKPTHLNKYEDEYSEYSPSKTYLTLSETYDKLERGALQDLDEHLHKHESYRFTPKRDDKFVIKNDKQNCKFSHENRDNFARHMPFHDNQCISKYPSCEPERPGLEINHKMSTPVSIHEKHNIRRREKEPQTFDGKTIDWQDYLVHFEQVAEWNEWNNIEKAKQIVMSLRGPAQKILSTLNKQDLGNYIKIRDSLGSRFNPKEREAAYSCEFESRRQNRDETVSEYGQALRRLGYLAFPNEKQDSDMLEKVLINKFIRGLNNLDLQKHVQFQRAKTLDTAISYAIEYEAFINPQNHMRKPTVNESEIKLNEKIFPIQALKENKNENNNSRVESITLDQVTKLIDEKLKQFCRTETEVEHRPRNYQNRSSRFNGRGSGRYIRNQTHITDRICYLCNERGHIQYYCPNQQGN